MVTIRYFAAARAARGAGSETVEASGDTGTLGGLLDDLGARHTGTTGAGMTLAQVLERCTFLVDGRRSGRSTDLTGAEQVDVLPPFAGG